MLLVIIAVELTSEEVLMGYERAYLCYDHPRPQANIADESDPSLHWMSNDNELIWEDKRWNTQRNVNLSPRAAPETSHLSSRICHTAWVSAD